MRSAGEGRGPARPAGTAAWLFGGALLVYLATAAGHISSSDGHTMFRLTESLVERRSVAVSEGNAERGPDGRLYPKAGLGQALASAPFYLAGRVVAGWLEPPLEPFAVKAVTSLVAAFAGAAAVALLFLTVVELGLSLRQGLVLALVAAFGTPLWVYARLYLAESLLAAALALELYGLVRARRGGGAGAGLAAGCGLGLAVLTKYAILPAAALLAIAVVPALKRWRVAAGFALSVGLFLAAALYYNEIRTGTPWASGYGRQGTWAAFTTPLFVGLYGLLLSSGKGLLWFAPIVSLAPASLLAWRRQDAWLALPVLAAALGTVLLYASFEHWAGDGSWGPRYLVPLLPLLVAAVGARLADRTLARRSAWWIAVVFLGLAGVAVQKGGVFVAVGAEMREVGDFPYTRALDDPRFLGESHWNPRFSPIAIHWRMLARNAREHVEGRWPRLRLAEGVAGESRHGLSSTDVEALTHGFDLWPAYAVYAGRSPAVLAAAWLLLLAMAIAALAAAWHEAGRHERRAGAGVRGP